MPMMFQLRPVCFVLILSFLAPVCTAQEADQETQNEEVSTGKDDSIAKEIATTTKRSLDEKLTQRITGILKRTDWVSNPSVEVLDGVVFLNGLARTLDSKERAGTVAENTQGVAVVVNRIQVDNAVSISEATTIVVTSLKSLGKEFLAHLPLLVAGFLALVVTGIASRVAKMVMKKVASRSRVQGSLKDLLLQLMTIAIWVTGLLVAAIIVFPGMTPSKALTVLGLGSVAIGFAFKDIFENFFAGILILWKYPFERGDFIECGEITGSIEDVTIRMAMIRQVNGELTVVPNAMLFKQPVEVLTDKSSRRTTINCGVAYDTDLDKASDIMQRAVKSCTSVHSDNPIQIFAQELADSSINFEVTWWTDSKPLDIRKSRDEVVFAVKKSLDDAGIEIPFPQRRLWIPDAVAIEHNSSEKQNS